MADELSRKRAYPFEDPETPRTPRTRQRLRDGDEPAEEAPSQRRALNLKQLQVPDRLSNAALPLKGSINTEDVDESAKFGDGGSEAGGEGDTAAKGCRCGRSKCLKQYCQCFRNDVRCSSECTCTDCHNDNKHEKQRVNAIRRIRRNNTSAFKGTALEVTETEVRTPGGTVKHARGCRCKRSKCQKKYCECYGAGLACTANCVCTDCENGNERSPRAEDLILKPDLAKVQPAHQASKSKAAPPKAPAGPSSAAHAQWERPHQQQGMMFQQPQATQGSSSSTSMKPPKRTPSNLYSKKRPGMTVQVPNPSLPVETGLTPSYAAGQQDFLPPFPSRELSGMRSATPKGGYGAMPSASDKLMYDIPLSGRQDSTAWDQSDLYASGGGLRSDGSLSGMGLLSSPRTRRQSALSLERNSSDLSLGGGVWGAAGGGGGGMTPLRRSARGHSSGDFAGLHRNTPPVSPMVESFGWEASTADDVVNDPEGILSGPLSARAWVNHIPAPNTRELSGLSSIGR